MAGPHYLSYVATDGFFCGGPYPSTARVVLVFDLEAKKPVDWKAILPPSLNVLASLSTAADKSRIGLITSKKLDARYAQEMIAQGGEPWCADILKNTAYSFILWPDAASRALVFDQNSLPHSAAICGGQMKFSPNELLKAGAAKKLIDALSEAEAPAQ